MIGEQGVGKRCVEAAQYVVELVFFRETEPYM